LNVSSPSLLGIFLQNNNKSIKTSKMLKLPMKIIRRTHSKSKILEAKDDSTSTIMVEMNDSASSFNISSQPSNLHWRDSLGFQAEANQRSSSEDRKRKKSVSFGDITIREHPMIVGDSICRRGVPLTIDWEAQSEVVLKVDDYEEYRPERRRGQAMNMPPNVRLTLAMNSGCTMRMVRSVVSECERIRKERTSSLSRSEKWSRFSKVIKKNVSLARSA
jgi:hypothetical protein